MRIYVDACHSGSALDTVGEWIIKNGGEKKHGRGKTFARCRMEYFKAKCNLWLHIWTACTAEEVSNDAGEGKGGLWSNEFMGAGLEPVVGTVLHAKKPNG